MTRSYRTRTVSIDSDALDRLEHYAVESDVYDSKRDAVDDDYEEVLDDLLDDEDEDDHD